VILSVGMGTSSQVGSFQMKIIYYNKYLQISQ
jgi:hypothetical protein